MGKADVSLSVTKPGTLRHSDKKKNEYTSVVGVILPVENEILPIIHLILKLTKHNHFFTLFSNNTAVVILLVVKIAALHMKKM